MTDVTVTFDLRLTDDTPDGFRWLSVRLVDAGGGGVLADDGTITAPQRVQVDADGAGSIVLHRNSDITPDGTFYRITAEGTSPTLVRNIALDGSTTSPISWADSSIQVLSPVPPEYVPMSGSGSGDVVGPSSSVDGRPALFDGTTGKLLKQGSALGDAAYKSTGTTAGTVAAGDDSRLSDARTPTAHKTSHATGGTDALTASDIGAAATSHVHAGADITSGTVASARLGSGSPSSSTFLRGDQTWAAATDAGAAQKANNLSDLASAATARTNLDIESSLTFSNADYTISTTAVRTTVLQTGTLSALRTVTLPAANAVPAGATVSVNAGAGCSPRYAVAIVPAGSDTINGSALASYLSIPYATQEFISNGTDAWVISTLPPGGSFGVSQPSDTYVGPLVAAGLSVSDGTLSSLLSNVLGRVYFCPIPVFRAEACDGLVVHQAVAGTDSGLTGELQLAIPGTYPGRVDGGISGGDYDATATAGLRVVTFSGGSKLIRPGLRWGVMKVRCSTSAGTNPQWRRLSSATGLGQQAGEAPAVSPATQGYWAGATSTAACVTDLGSLTWTPNASNATPWIALRRA